MTDETSNPSSKPAPGSSAAAGADADTPGDMPGDMFGGAAEDAFGEAAELLDDARRRLAGVPAEVVVANHVMGLYELAAIHLGAAPPDLAQAALAIDAVGCLVEGLGDRLGPDAATLRDALANIRLAFVQIKSSVSG